MTTARRKTRQVGTGSTVQRRRRRPAGYNRAVRDLKAAFAALKATGAVHPTDLKAVLEEVSKGVQRLTLFQERCK